jgi:hypothetical protein
MADSDGSGSGAPTLVNPAVRAVLPRLSIQHLPLTIVEYELKNEQDREQRRVSLWPLNAEVRGIHT